MHNKCTLFDLGWTKLSEWLHVFMHVCFSFFPFTRVTTTIFSVSTTQNFIRPDTVQSVVVFFSFLFLIYTTINDWHIVFDIERFTCIAFEQSHSVELRMKSWNLPVSFSLFCHVASVNDKVMKWHTTIRTLFSTAYVQVGNDELHWQTHPSLVPFFLFWIWKKRFVFVFFTFQVGLNRQKNWQNCVLHCRSAREEWLSCGAMQQIELRWVEIE